MNRISRHVFGCFGIGFEVNQGDVFEGAVVVLLAPFGVAVAVGTDARAEDFADFGSDAAKVGNS